MPKISSVKWTPEMDAELRRMWDEGLWRKVIMQRLDITDAQLNYRRRVLVLPTRKAGRVRSASIINMLVPDVKLEAMRRAARIKGVPVGRYLEDALDRALIDDAAPPAYHR